MFLFVAPSFSEDCADTRIPSPRLTTTIYSMSSTSLSACPFISTAPPTSASSRSLSSSSPDLPFAGCVNVTSRRARRKLHSGIHSLRIISLPASASIISRHHMYPRLRPRLPMCQSFEYRASPMTSQEHESLVLRRRCTFHPRSCHIPQIRHCVTTSPRATPIPTSFESPAQLRHRRLSHRTLKNMSKCVALVDRTQPTCRCRIRSTPPTCPIRGHRLIPHKPSRPRTVRRRTRRRQSPSHLNTLQMIYPRLNVSVVPPSPPIVAESVFRHLGAHARRVPRYTTGN